MNDRREAAEAIKASPRWLSCLLRAIGLLMFAILCALIGCTYGYLSTYREAEREYVEVITAAFYDPEARTVLLESGSSYVRDELNKVIKDNGEATSYRITRVDPGPAKTFIDVRVVRNGKEFNENILFIARKLRDFTSKPVGATDS